MRVLSYINRENCPCCNGGAVKKAFNVRYEDLFCGLIEDSVYEQEVCYCEECHMIYTKNPISSDILNMYYKHLSRYVSTEDIGGEDYSLRSMYERQFAFINNEIQDYQSVLEIGAATGESLSLYKKIGKQVKGVEPNTLNKVFAKKKYGVELIDKTFDEWEKVAGTEHYDMFFMSHVLEHIVDFRNTIEKIDRFTPKYFFIEVPCIESKGRGMEPFGMITPEHVNLFGKDSLTYLMGECGYILLKCEFPQNDDGTAPLQPTIMTLWKKADNNTKRLRSNTVNPEKELADYFDRANSEFKTKVIEVIDNIDSNAKIAIWGTGIHTARLLGMTNLKEMNIVKFYDSDFRKYDMSILGRPIEHFSANDIDDEMVDTILISSYASKFTIKKAIEEECGCRKVDILQLYM